MRELLEDERRPRADDFLEVLLPLRRFADLRDVLRERELADLRDLDRERLDDFFAVLLPRLRLERELELFFLDDVLRAAIWFSLLAIRRARKSLGLREATGNESRDE